MIRLLIFFIFISSFSFSQLEFEKLIYGDLRNLRIAKKEFDYFYNEAISVYPELAEFSPYELLVEEKEIEETYYSVTKEEYKKLSKEAKQVLSKYPKSLNLFRKYLLFLRIKHSCVNILF